ncbi:MAG: hypothetical protein U9O95_05010, partial [Candidatus Marinimicrobia bacterium]|nr:hypothetical protein [Candidatus Neomarinimicrobiota bacterium]
AKFAVKGFSEGLLIDLRQNAPHVKVSVVMPGHIGTPIGFNSQKILGKPAPEDMTSTDVAQAREMIENRGISTTGLNDEEIKAFIRQQMETFRDDAPLTPSQAATIILDGVRNEQWRIIVGEDAQILDRMVRENPETAYESSFMDQLLEKGYFGSLGMSDVSAEGSE